LDKGEKLKSGRSNGGAYRNGMYLTVGGAPPEIKVSKETLEQIRSGKKTYDIRPFYNKSWVAKVKENNQEVMPFVSKDGSEHLNVLVSNVRPFKDLKDLKKFKDVDKTKIFPGKNVETALEEFYGNERSKEKMKKEEMPYAIMNLTPQ